MLRERGGGSRASYPFEVPCEEEKEKSLESCKKGRKHFGNYQKEREYTQVVPLSIRSFCCVVRWFLPVLYSLAAFSVFLSSFRLSLSPFLNPLLSFCASFSYRCTWSGLSRLVSEREVSDVDRARSFVCTG